MDLLYHVAYWGEKGASDGMITDAKGAIYAGDYENNSIRRSCAEWHNGNHRT